MVLSSRLLSAGLLAVLARASNCAITPANALKVLNNTLHGRVHPNLPFALPCFSEYEGKPVERDDALCAERQANYRSPTYRREFPGAYMYEQSAICASDTSSTDQCLLNTDDPDDASAWTGVDCKQGNLPSYYLEVKEANDVVQAFKYARRSGAKLSIKNSGHTYVEDASQRGALTLWTRNLKALSHDESFVPAGCAASEAYDAITTGAGISCGEAYDYANQENVTIICGYSATVGLSGGFVQNGGHSVLTNVYGLAADRVVQFTVVTPDGEVRVANKCQNPDLFWALRGGGGGTFGVVIDSTHKVEPVFPISVASIKVPSTDKAAFYGFMEVLVDRALDMAADGWGGHIYGNSLVHVSPLMTTEADARKSLSDVIEFAESHGGSAAVGVSPSWHHFYQEYILSGSVTVGNLNIINTRLVPKTVFADASLKTDFLAFIKKLIDDGGSPYIPVDSPYVFRHEEGATSVVPAWYGSVWEFGIPSYWAWNSTFEDRVDVARAMQNQTAQLEALTPGGGAYKNEANPFTLDWQDAWYGANYDRLLGIKNKYDPRGLLSCWGCVGWSADDASQSCYSAFADLAAGPWE